VKDQNKMLFATKKRFPFSGNIRLVCEEMMKSRSKKIYIYDEGYIPKETLDYFEQNGVTVLKSFSARALYHIVSASVVVLSHSARDVYISKKSNQRKIVNLWHGVPIKKIELAMPNISKSRKKLIQNNSKLYDMMVASSSVDALAMSACFMVEHAKVKQIGLPRFDILDSGYQLPRDQEELIKKLLEKKGNKKLIVFAPTFREKGKSALSYFSHQHIETLRAFLSKNNAIFGVRTHSYETNQCEFIDDETIIDCSSIKYPETNLLLKYTDILVVDYSSIWVDFMLLDRPIVSFVPDKEHYEKKERDFLYDYEEIVPAKKCADIADLIKELERLLLNPVLAPNYAQTKQMLLAHTKECTKKVVQKLEGIG